MAQVSEPNDDPIVGINVTPLVDVALVLLVVLMVCASYLASRTIPVDLPKGTKFKIIAHFDNSANKRGNPNPDEIVRWGSPTKKEMMDGWL